MLITSLQLQFINNIHKNDLLTILGNHIDH